MVDFNLYINLKVVINFELFKFIQMAYNDNFLGFSEADENRTDGIYGLFKYANKVKYHEENDDFYNEDSNDMYHNKQSNEDLFNVLDNNEKNNYFDIESFLNKESKKRVQFSSDQLEFAVDNNAPIFNEQPDPLIFKNGKRQKSKSRSASSKRPLSNSAKKPSKGKFASLVSKVRSKKQKSFNDKGKPYLRKQRPAPTQFKNKEWNDRTTISGLFSEFQKSKREVKYDNLNKSDNKDLKVRPGTSTHGKNHVDFFNNKGQKTGSLRMNRDLMTVQDQIENSKNSNLKSLSSSFWGNVSQRVKSKSRSASKPKTRSVSRTERNKTSSLGAVFWGNPSESKISQELKKNGPIKEKENLVKQLKKELESEREKRKTMDSTFKNQFSQLQSQIQELKTTGIKEKPRELNKDLNHESLDLIPSRDKPIPKTKSHSFKTEKYVPYKSPFGQPKITTTLFKNVQSRYKEPSKKLESSLPPRPKVILNEEEK